MIDHICITCKHCMNRLIKIDEDNEGVVLICVLTGDDALGYNTIECSHYEFDLERVTQKEIY
jgi:hypothetical protein